MDPDLVSLLANGWNNTDVTVALSASDEGGSGAKEMVVDTGTGPQTGQAAGLAVSMGNSDVRRFASHRLR